MQRTLPKAIDPWCKSWFSREKAPLWGFAGLIVLFGGSAIEGGLRPYAAIAAGYAAKVAGTACLIAGRELDDVRRDELGFLPPLSLELDRERGVVEAALLGLPWVSRRAVLVEGGGVVLCPSDLDEPSIPAVRLPTRSQPDDAALWPVGERVILATDDALERAVAGVFDGEGAIANLHTRAVVVVSGGRIVAERYAMGCDAQTVLPGWSMAKSVTNVLVGLRVAEGAIRLTQPTGFEEWAADARSNITLEDLLRMQSGLEFIEDYADPRSHVLRMLYGAGDMARFAALSPMRFTPGARFHYASGSSLLVQRILRASFEHDDEYRSFPYRRLFGPLGLRSALIECDASGTFVGSSYVHMTARDWARFGWFVRSDGAWGGRRLLPEGFLAWSTTATSCAPKGDYGAHWWLNRGIDGGDTPYPTLPRDLFLAAGHEGQYVVIVPSHDAVIVRLGLTQDGVRFPLEEFVRAVLAAL